MKAHLTTETSDNVVAYTDVCVRWESGVASLEILANNSRFTATPALFSNTLVTIDFVQSRPQRPYSNVNKSNLRTTNL